MATLEKQAVRATITLGDGIEVETPNVMSFNVSRARGQMYATFSASIKVDYNDITSSTQIVDSSIVIRAGLKGRERTVFTGTVYKCTVNPVRTDASKVMLNISGKDPMAVMEGQWVNRRLKTYRDGETPPERWGVVNSISKENTPLRKGLKTKVYTSEPIAVINLKNTTLYKTPDGFKLGKNYEKGYKRQVFGTLSAEKVPSGE